MNAPWKPAASGNRDAFSAFLCDEAALDVLRVQPGITRAKLGAQTHALGFYEKLGFTAYGPVYDDAGIPHRDMTRDL